MQPLLEAEGAIAQPFKRGIKYRRGRVLRLGKYARGVEEGQIVLYEAHSAHSGQTEPLRAEWFGGNEGAWAFLVRAPRKAAPSSEILDQAHDRITAEVEGMQRYWGETIEENIPDDQKQLMLLKKNKLLEIDHRRRFMRRSRRLGHTDDNAVRQGIFAVEDDCSPEVDCFYKDGNP